MRSLLVLYHYGEVPIIMVDYYSSHALYCRIRPCSVKITKQQKTMNEKDVVDALKFDKELPQLKDQFQLLIEEINSLEYKRNSLRTALSDLQNQVSAARD